MSIPIKIIAENRKARFNYTLTDTFEAGIALLGSEVKSLRNSSCQLQDSYVAFQNGEVVLYRANISQYKASSYNNHEPERIRKLLLNKNEINKIYSALEEKGMACVPTKMYFKKGFVKVEIALAKGKNRGDKRETVKKRDANRELQRTMRHSRGRDE
jgi:SsrA-binding protein